MTTFWAILGILVTGIGSYYAYKTYYKGDANSGTINENELSGGSSISRNKGKGSTYRNKWGEGSRIDDNQLG